MTNEYLEMLRERQRNGEVDRMPRLSWDADVEVFDLLQLRGGHLVGPTRDELCHRYAWAIPDDAAVAILAKHSPLVEMGAGSGYWAYLAAEAGADVVAYDAYPPGADSDEWHEKAEPWFPVAYGTPDWLEVHADRALLLCWPPYGDFMAADCLAHYRGHTVIYVGEAEGGCCAEDGFFEALAAEWNLVESHWLPQYFGLHDHLTVWERQR